MEIDIANGTLTPMFKRFLEWIKVKQKFDDQSDKHIYFKDREIWWSVIGENIGVEINGKGILFSRPVLIYKKLSKNSFLGVPLSTKIKEGSWYALLDFKDQTVCANLAQIRVLSSGRLHQKIGEIPANDFAKVKSGFLRLYS